MHQLRRQVPLLLVPLALSACAGGEAPRAGREAAPPEGGVASVQTYGAPQEVELTSVGYSLGSPDAPVTVMEFSDFGCPYCARFALESLPQLAREYVESGQVRWQYVPFELGTFPNGAEAARAGECAGEQGQFWKMHDLLYEHQREWKSTGSPEVLFGSLARAAGLDLMRFASCYRENRGGERTAINNEVARQLGVRATPSFLVNGRPVEGALPLEQFRQLLQWAGAEASRR